MPHPLRDRQAEAPILQDATDKLQGAFISRAEFEALLDLQLEIAKALDQCVGVYSKLTSDLRARIKDLRR